MGLPHVVVRILGKGAPAHQVQPRRARRGGTPVQSQRLALDPGGSGVTMNIRPSLMKVISWNHDAYRPFGGPTRWKDRLRLILLGKERFELCRVRTGDNDIRKGTHVLEIRFLEFSSESFVPALVHSIFLEVVDVVDNFIPGGRNGFLCNSFNNGRYLFTTRAS